jgi:hypothetical protein
MPAERSPSETRARLHALSERLREAKHIEPAAQQELAQLVDELGAVLDSGSVPSAELAHLTDSAARLLQGLEQQHGSQQLLSARERLEVAILNAESRAPRAADIARRLVEALAGLGI